MNDLIYLDHNATTPVDRRVFEHMAVFLTQKWGNPSSGHPVGWDAREAVEVARGQVARLLGCEGKNIIFTSGGTEANNLAITGTASRATAPAHIATTNIEHPATVEPLRMLEGLGWRITRAPVDRFGVVVAAEMCASMVDETALVTIMHSNNETGSLQPVPEIARAAARRGALVHVDAAQSVGKVPVKVDELGADLLSVAGHKLYAPKGVGALFVRDGVKIDPVLRGAGQESGTRPGTENVAGIAALGKACEIAGEALEEELVRQTGLRDRLWEGLASEIPRIILNGHPEKRLPNTLNVLFPRVRGSLLLARCDEIAASTGAACHEGGDEIPSAVLTVMGIPSSDALGAARLTIGRSTTQDQVDRAAGILTSRWKELVTGQNS